MKKNRPAGGYTRLRDERKAQALTLEQLAGLVSAHLKRKVALSTVQRYETGERPMTLDTLHDFASCLKCTPADLLRLPPPGLTALESVLLRAFRCLSAEQQTLLVQTAETWAGTTPPSPKRRRQHSTTR